MHAIARFSAIATTTAVMLMSFATLGGAAEPPLTHPADVPPWETNEPIEPGPQRGGDGPRDHGDNGRDHYTADGGTVSGPALPRPTEPVLVEVGEIPKLNPVAAECVITDRTFPNGAPVIEIENTGTVSIPAGSKITITYSNGTTRTFLVSSDILPGAKAGISGPAVLLGDPEASCAASVEIAVPEIQGDVTP
jgi:hypothetical protein